MVKVENLETYGWEAAIRGMRNPLNSWAKSDSFICDEKHCKHHEGCDDNCNRPDMFVLGPNDLDLALRLIKAGPEHRKFLRMVHISMDITGPLYWWKEFDTYKVATVANSCSTMHKIQAKEFTFNDFSIENLNNQSLEVFDKIISCLNANRIIFNVEHDKDAWWQMIQLLPSSYNQKRTWDGTFETVLSILHQRDHHKLNTDWEPFRQCCFENIPYCKEFYNALYGKDDENARAQV